MDEIHSKSGILMAKNTTERARHPPAPHHFEKEEPWRRQKKAEARKLRLYSSAANNRLTEIPNYLVIPAVKMVAPSTRAAT